MYINLVLAVFWLVLGLALLFMTWHPEAMGGRGEVFGVSSGWVALLLAAYNVLRFVGSLSRRPGTYRSCSTPEASPREPGTPHAYDPAFDFSKSLATNDTSTREKD